LLFEDHCESLLIEKEGALMRTFNFSGKSPILIQGLAVVIASASMVLAAGCGANSTIGRTAVTGNQATKGVINGRVHGGRQPITGATVTLWEAGNSGYFSSAISLATTTTDGSGNFNFQTNAPYTCPTSGSGILYMTAKGGVTTTGGVNNPWANLIAGLGPCANVLSSPPTVTINEVSTVGTIFALQQFFNPATESFGYPSTNYTGLNNAGDAIGNLVNSATGQVYPSQTRCGQGSGSNGTLTSSACVVITPEAAKINTIANILAACINDVSSYTAVCAPLATAIGGSPSDTLQMAYYMAATPTNNVSAVYSYGGASGPFQTPVPLSSAPADWTIGVTYGSESNTGGSTPYILGGPELLAIDSLGNVWIANYSSSAGSLTELSHNGTPMLNVLNTGQIVYPTGIVIDPNNNVYVSDYEKRPVSTTIFNNQVVEYTETGGSIAFTVGNGPGQMVSDPSGNIFIVETSSTVNSVVGPGALEEIPAGSTVTSPTTPVQIGSTGQLWSKNSGIVMDQNYNIWIGGAGNSAHVYPYTYSYSGGPTWTLGTPATPSCLTKGYGAAIDSTGNIWLPNGGLATGSVCEVYASSSGSVSGPSTAYTGGGLAYPYYVAVDGAGNLWVTNDTTSVEAVSEFTNSGTALSPSGGFVHTFAETYAIAVDASGNVWVGNYNVTGNGTTYGYITEIVGAAVPTVTPIAAGLPSSVGGTMKIGTRP